VLVHPRGEFAPALRQAGLRLAAVEILACRLVRPDLGAGRPERGQAVEVVRVVVRDDDMADRPVAHAADRREQRAAQRRRAQGIDHHHPLGRDDEAGVRNVALVGGGCGP